MAKLALKHRKAISAGLRKHHASKGTSKNWIASAVGKPGSLHREMHIPIGTKIPASKLAKAAHAGGLLGKRARLAETLKSFHKK